MMSRYFGVHVLVGWSHRRAPLPFQPPIAATSAPLSEPIAATESSQTPANQQVIVDLRPGSRRATASLVLIANSSSGVGYRPAPAGWTRVVQGVGTFNATAIWTRIADGTEGTSLTMPWRLRQSHPALVGPHHRRRPLAAGDLLERRERDDDHPGSLRPRAPRCWGAADVLWIGWLGKRLCGTATDYPDGYSLYQFRRGTPPSGTGATAVAVAARRRPRPRDPNTFTISDSGNSSFGTLAVLTATPLTSLPCLRCGRRVLAGPGRQARRRRDLPAGIQAGDRLVTLIAAHSSAGNALGAAPAGWTRLVSVIGTFNAT